MNDVNNPASWQAQRHTALVAEALEMLDSPEMATLAHLRRGLRSYLEERIETGGFLRHCLENDFVGAVGLAHPLLTLTQLKALRDLLVSAFPADAWGSPEKVRAWLVVAGPGEEA